ncbi:CBS domain-containing protein, partial [Streptomyces sp. NPDC002758]
ALSTFYGPGWSVAKLNRLSEKPPRLRGGGVTTADDSLDQAVGLMREHTVRRLPVVDDADQPIGIASLGDLAIERDENSALGDISAARPNM